MAATWKPKRGRKLTLAEIERALVAHDRAQVVSDEIRLVMGPWTAAGELPEHRCVTNSVVQGWRARLEERSAPRARTRSNGTDPLGELGKAVAARKRAESRIVAAVRSAKEAGVSVSDCASQLGMTRQGVYAMLARA